MHETFPDFNPDKLWELFIRLFREEIRSHTDFSSLFDTIGRTEFYRNFFPNFLGKFNNLVSVNGKLSYRKELFSRVDHCLVYNDDKHKWDVPIILIEVENNSNPESNFQEIFKMCYLNAPLRIVFLTANWADQKEDIVERYWYGIIEAYLSSIGVNGNIGVFFLDTSGEDIKYFYHLLVSNGKLVDQSKELKDCQIIVTRKEI